MFYKSLLFVYFSYSTFVNAANVKVARNCSVDEVDFCAQQIYVYGNKSFVFPKTRETTIAHCKSIKVAEHCVREYGRECLRPFGRQYLSLLMKGPSDMLKRTCSDKGIQEYLSHNKCMNESKQHLDECQMTTIEDMLKVKLAKRQDWISMICCFLSKLELCSDAAIESHCKGNSLTYLKNIVHGYQGDVNDLLCNQGLKWGSKTCNALTRNLGTNNATEKKPMSVIPITLDLFKKIIK